MRGLRWGWWGTLALRVECGQHRAHGTWQRPPKQEKVKPRELASHLPPRVALLISGLNPESALTQAGFLTSPWSTPHPPPWHCVGQRGNADAVLQWHFTIGQCGVVPHSH